MNKSDKIGETCKSIVHNATEMMKAAKTTEEQELAYQTLKNAEKQLTIMLAELEALEQKNRSSD
jgi:hypothetical protein